MRKLTDEFSADLAQWQKRVKNAYWKKQKPNRIECGWRKKDILTRQFQSCK